MGIVLRSRDVLKLDRGDGCTTPYINLFKIFELLTFNTRVLWYIFYNSGKQILFKWSFERMV